MMEFVLIVQSLDMARKEAEPFIPESLLLQSLYGVIVFGPYPDVKAASAALRTFPSGEFNLKVAPLKSLSEQLDNPYGALWAGDSPEWESN
jgi:hypothetical protein